MYNVRVLSEDSKSAYTTVEDDLILAVGDHFGDALRIEMDVVLETRYVHYVRELEVNTKHEHFTLNKTFVLSSLHTVYRSSRFARVYLNSVFGREDGAA